MKFWTDCKACNGRGEVLPSSPFATKPPNMTGEITDLTKSACKKCDGSGISWKMEIGILKLSREQWADQFDQQTALSE
jgi:hypothetical protein